MATIEIWTRNVKKTCEIPILGYPHHLFLIYTDDNCNKEILRGGTEDDNPFGRSELTIVKQNYNSKKQKSDNSKTYDYYDPNNSSSNPLNYQGKIILKTDEVNTSKSIAMKWEKMWDRAQDINQEEYDYEFLTQNSNTAVVQMAKAVSLNNEVKAFIDANSLFAPADKAELEHSLIDRSYDVAKALTDSVERSKGTIEEFKLALQKLGMNPYVWLSLVAKVLQRPIEDLLKAQFKALINKLIGNIDPLKPVIVLKESKTGRNELFVDQLTGALMDRKGFAALIDSGQYEGYTLASIDGIATPMSKPDTVTSNNLG
tara:strand:+ start:2012 stop:2956 length:945 start_codon:yes stop_codon:yes gene_type:complete